MRPTGFVRTAAMLLLFAPVACELQRDVRGEAQQEGSMTGSHNTGTQGQATSRVRTEGRETVVPVVQEELHVNKRQVETGRVRVTKTIHEQEVLIEEPSTHEEVQIERVPVNQVVAEQSRYAMKATP
jgi:stress response protein YsnF